MGIYHEESQGQTVRAIVVKEEEKGKEGGGRGGGDVSDKNIAIIKVLSKSD